MNLKDTSYLLIKLFFIKLGLFNEAEDIKNIMYESYKENTSSINKKILNFIKNSILLNPNYFDNILSEEEAEIDKEEKKSEEENNNKEERDSKKNKPKKKDESSKIEDEMKKMILKNKEKQLEEIFKKIELRHKEILKQKPYYICEPTLTINTLIKDFIPP